MTARSETRSEGIYNAVRADILNGVLAPGSKLGFADIGARYTVSTGVLREVLPRLVEQGLAGWEPQLGYRVVSLTVPDLMHLTEARVAFEAMVLTQSVITGGLEWETGVVAAHHHLSKTPTHQDEGTINLEWPVIHARFHRALLSGCPNPRLRDIVNDLRDVSEVYRCWSVTPGTAHMRDVAAEHKAIADAAIARDVDGAVGALTAHIQATTYMLLESQKQDTDVSA